MLRREHFCFAVYCPVVFGSYKCGSVSEKTLGCGCMGFEVSATLVPEIVSGPSPLTLKGFPPFQNVCRMLQFVTIILAKIVGS